MFLLAVLLIMAWKTAGYYGRDRFLLLPLTGSAWQPTPIKQEDTTEKTRSASAT